MLEGVALSRRVKRKCSIVASGNSLVLLALTPYKLQQMDGIHGWWQQLANGTLATSVGLTSGVDAIVAEKIQANGGNLSTLLTKQAAKENKDRTSSQSMGMPPTYMEDRDDPLDA